MESLIDGKVWVVGGTSGIGQAIAKELELYAIKTVCSDKQDADVRNPSILREFEFINGRFDGIVYSAGKTELDWLGVILPQTMQDIFHVNVTGLINVLQACPSAKRVLVVGSDAAWRPMRTSTAYVASKAALHAAVACIARERASDDFAINVVAPGMTEPTHMQEYIDKTVPEIRGWSPEQAYEYEQSQIPMARRATVEEVAEVACKILTMETNYLNGAVIPVNGAR